jgi:hypothetical protein
MGPESAPVLLTCGTLIDGTGAGPVRDAAVLMDAGRIAYAGSRHPVRDLRGIRVIDAPGKTVVPGLIDLHNHSTFDADMRVYVKNGVTTIRFAGLNQDAVVTLRDRVMRNEVPGPRIFSCGPMLDKAPPAYPRWTSPVNTPAEATATARRLLSEDRVEALIVTQQITPDLLRPIVQVGHAFGRPVVGQLWGTDGLEAAALGIDQLDNYSRIFASREYPKARLLAYRSVAERLSLLARGWATVDWDLTKPIIEAMVHHRISYCPTLVVHRYQADLGGQSLEVDPDYQTMFGEPERKEWTGFMEHVQGAWTDEDRSYMRIAYEKRLEWIRRFHALGGTVVVGTDMQFGGIMVHEELRQLEAAGLSRMDVLRAATGSAARALGMADSLGAIQPGRMADLVVLNRDPLEDLSALHDISCVFKGGAIIQP